MTSDEILSYCLRSLKDTVLVKSWGEKGIFYNPNGALKRGVYVLTVKETFIERFGYIPKRPLAGETVNMDFDFTVLDTIIPHPVYAWMGWICVLNPSDKTFEAFKGMIQEAYAYAKEKFEKRRMTYGKAHVYDVD